MGQDAIKLGDTVDIPLEGWRVDGVSDVRLKAKVIHVYDIDYIQVRYLNNGEVKIVPKTAVTIDNSVDNIG